MTANHILAALSADPWVHARVWQYDPERTVGVVARSYAAAVFREGGSPPNEGEASGGLRHAGEVDGGHSAEWWAVQLLREIGWLLCTEHPEGIRAAEARWIRFGERWAELVGEIIAWEEHHWAIRPAVAAGTYNFGGGSAGIPSPEWKERERQRYVATAAWVDAGGLARFRATARRWALRADQGLGTYGPMAEWVSSTAFREEAGTDIVPRRLPPDPGSVARIDQSKADGDAHWAATQEAIAAGEAAWKQWREAVDAAFPGIPWHGQTAYRGGVGPH